MKKRGKIRQRRPSKNKLECCKNFSKILAIVQVIISTVLLATLFLLWLSMHVYGIVLSRYAVYYGNIFLTIPAGILLVTSIMLLVKLKRR